VSAQAIACFVVGQTLEDYEGNLMLRSACERQFEIIGEAMSRLRDQHSDLFDQITTGRAIVAFRNRLIHGYDSVDSEIVWDVISHELVALDGVVQLLLNQMG